MTAIPQIIPTGVVTQEFRTPGTIRRGVIAGVAGNVLEWYDFALFGFFAQQIGTHFFPTHNPTASLLAALGTFAAGFVMRPLGGALFGWVGDRFGRKQARSAAGHPRVREGGQSTPPSGRSKSR